MMAALSMVDHGLLDTLIPTPGQGGNASQESAFANMRDKILGAVDSCRKMLEEEPPERMTDYWGTVRLKLVARTRLTGVARDCQSDETTSKETAEMS
jgi:hypothetical protein